MNIEIPYAPALQPAADPLIQSFAVTPLHRDERLLDEQVTELLDRFLASDRVTSSASFEEVTRMFPATELPAAPEPLPDYLRALDARVVGHSINTASPKYIGHMTTALPYFVRPLSRLVAGLNQNPVKVETAKAITPLERDALALLHRLIFDRGDAFYLAHAQDAGSTLGVVTGGGTAANITALWIARNAALGPRGAFAGVEREGLAAALSVHGSRRAVILGSTLMHYSMEKAADLLGLGTAGLVRVDVDTRGRVKVDLLQRALSECKARGELVLAVVGVAGSTDTGSIDPLEDIAALADEAGVHFHVDAAWGGPLLFSSDHRRRLAGIERAATVTIDGHKQLYLPMGLGVIALRDPQSARAIEKQARYIIRPGSPDLGRRSLEGSRPAMSLLLHAALNLIGRDAYARLVDEGIDRARALAAAIRQRPAFELIGEPDCNIVNYRYLPPAHRGPGGALSPEDNQEVSEINQRLQELQKQLGRSFVSRTTLTHTAHGPANPITVLRAVLANPLTRQVHLDAVLDEQVALAASL